MGQINQALLARIEKSLGLSRGAVYRRIQKIANDEFLENDLAALKLGVQLGIGIQRFSTPDQRAEVRNSMGMPRAEPRPTMISESPISRTPKRRSRSQKTADSSVFVVHGRNEKIRKGMFSFLRSLGLKPMEWGHAVEAASGANPYVGEILDRAMSRVQAVVVILSPDDESKLRDQFCRQGEQSTEGKLRGQARANVLFEAGDVAPNLPAFITGLCSRCGPVGTGLRTRLG